MLIFAYNSDRRVYKCTNVLGDALSLFFLLINQHLLEYLVVLDVEKL